MIANTPTDNNTKELLSRLSPHIVEAIKKNPSILDKEIEARKKYFPAKDFIPNIGQERAAKCYIAKHQVYNDFPKKMFFFGGNGVGKTALMAVLLNGVTLGVDFSNMRYFNYDFFRECENIRRKRPIKIRIVCNKADTEENGSVTQQIRQWIPTAKFGNKVSTYYLSIKIPAPTKEFKPTYIDIKTHDMKVTAHAGPDYDIVIFNEPPPRDIYAENEGRTRMNGRIMAFLTPLNMAEYMQSIIDQEAPEGEIYHTRAAIWDNCNDIPGNRGRLTRRDIESMIRTWRATDPMQVPAREEGRFMHLAGAVFKIFNDTIHVIDPMPIQPSWNIYQIVDHHPTKPAFAVWLALDALRMFYVIAEYPTEKWDDIRGTIKTIKQFGHDFKLIENGKNPHFNYITRLRINERYGDPNAFKAQQPHNRKTIKDQYEWDCGLEYNIDVVDNDINLRLDKIKSLLLYDPLRDVDSINSPHLFIFRSCKNCIRAMANHSIKKDRRLGGVIHGQYEDLWKDPIDCIGYGVTTIDGWVPNSREENISDDYREYIDGLNPHKKKRDQFISEEERFSSVEPIGRY